VCGRNIYRWLLIIIVPTVRAIITLIVAVGALTIIMALTLIVITFRRPIVRSTLIVATVGISWSHGNGKNVT
jgi:hypothetical protein